MGATPLYLASILARVNAYSRASATLRVSGTVSILILQGCYVVSEETDGWQSLTHAQPCLKACS